MGQQLLVTFLMLCAVFRTILSETWNYEDTTKWNETFPDCDNERQSPIDIRDVEICPMEPFTFINYGLINTCLHNNGHTMKVNSTTLPSPRVTGGGLGATYVLEQFHFHWGSNSHQGSEHLLNGHAFAGEMHLVHFKEEYGNYDEALEHEDGLVVLGVWLTEDQSCGPCPDQQHYQDSSEEDVSRQHHSKCGEEDKKQSSPNWWWAITPTNPENLTDCNLVNLRQLLPEDTDTFYRYNGSLTTPPCTENVMWTLMATPVKVPLSFLLALRELVNPYHTAFQVDHFQFHHKVDLGDHISDNFRPTQQIGSRKVFFSPNLEQRGNTCSFQDQRQGQLVFPSKGNGVQD